MRIGYARVSTTDQDVELQTVKLRDHGCERVFAEKISGASRENRDKLNFVINEMLEDGDVLVVTRLDRLARSITDLLGIVQEIEAKGASFVCVEQEINTGSATGRLQLHMLAAFAEFERGIMRERQRDGIAKAQAAGKYRGRVATINGAEVRERLAAGEKPTALARSLGISRSSIYRLAQEAPVAVPGAVEEARAAT